MKWLSGFVLLALAAMIAVSPGAYAVGEHDWLVMEEASEDESPPLEESGEPSEESSQPSEQQGAADEEPGALPEGGQAAPEPSEPLGLLDAVAASVDFEVPRDRMWPAPHARLVVVETLVICTPEGDRLERTNVSPEKGQYRPRLDGCVRFSQEDVGRKLRATYEYTPVRVALLPPIITTDYEDAWPTMLEVLTKEASARGYVFANADDVADSLVNLRITSPDQYPELARELDLGALIVAGIGASSEQVLAGFESMGGTTITGKVSDTGAGTGSVDGHTTGPIRMDAVYKSIMHVTVGLLVYDGATGVVIGEADRSDSKRVLLRRFGPTRRDLARHLTEKVVAAVFEPAT